MLRPSVAAGYLTEGEGVGVSRPHVRIRPPGVGHRVELLLRAAGRGTRDHSQEVAALAGAIADRLGLHSEERRRVTASAHLHDVGKSQIPASVVDKPGPLTPREWELIHLHTVAGERLVSELGEPRSVARAVRHSHERWDGHGYPDGLRGREIPLASRIVFCADAFDAICSDRPYRAARSAADGIAEIRRCAGSQFDPEVVEALVQVLRPRLHHRFRRERRRRGAHSPAATVVAFATAFAAFSFAALGEPAERVSAQSAVLSASASADPFEPGPLGSDMLASPAPMRVGESMARARTQEDSATARAEPSPGEEASEIAPIAAGPRGSGGAAAPSPGDDGDAPAAVKEGPVGATVDKIDSTEDSVAKPIEAIRHQVESRLP